MMIGKAILTSFFLDGYQRFKEKKDEGEKFNIE